MPYASEVVRYTNAEQVARVFPLPGSSLATIAAVARLTQRPFADNHFHTQAALEEFLTGAGITFDWTAQWQDGPGQPPLSDEIKAFVAVEWLWILHLRKCFLGYGAYSFGGGTRSTLGVSLVQGNG